MVEKIRVGKIINTHGIKGFVKVLPLTSDINRYDDLKEVYVDSMKLQLESVWYKKDVVMVKFKEYNNINDVLCFKDKYITIDEKDLKKLEEDEYFIFDLVGLKVYLLGGEYLGEVVDVLQPGANDVYVVKTEESEVLLPAVKDIVKEINIKEKKIIVDPIEGMIE
ncbi:ribosome maturation factor RimM [Clostridiaceae bacterium M8S5]|nr:ribosome maturation factor RimM [Clostridiaceae bacterium M8S5]